MRGLVKRDKRRANPRFNRLMRRRKTNNTHTMSVQLLQLEALPALRKAQHIVSCKVLRHPARISYGLKRDRLASRIRLHHTALSRHIEQKSRSSIPGKSRMNYGAALRRYTLHLCPIPQEV